MTWQKVRCHLGRLRWRFTLRLRQLSDSIGVNRVLKKQGCSSASAGERLWPGIWGTKENMRSHRWGGALPGQRRFLSLRTLW